MAWKDLFINSDEETNDNTVEKKQEAQTKFPSVSEVKTEPTEVKSTPLFNLGSTSTETFVPKQYVSTTEVSQDVLESTIRLYEKGFESLNQPGYDFFEFFKAIVGANAINNSQMYPMAFSMAQAMEKSLTKDALINQSEYYISEIEKVYQDYSSKGNTSKTNILNQKESETQSLSHDLDLMNQQMEQLMTQIESTKNKLSAIDSKYVPKINEVDQKLKANDIAKNQLTDKLQAVKQGIKNNL